MGLVLHPTGDDIKTVEKIMKRKIDWPSAIVRSAKLGSCSCQRRTNKLSWSCCLSFGGLTTCHDAVTGREREGLN